MSDPALEGLPLAVTLTRATGVSVAENLAAESLLLHSGEPTVRVATLRDTALTYGVAVPEGSPFVVRARRRGISTLRRSSGGTGVLHGPGDVAWALVLPRADPRVGRGFVTAYDRFGTGVVAALQREQIRAAWSPPLGLDPGCCLLSARGRVLRVGDRVLGGAAQHATARTLLHHGILPRAIDRDLLRAVFGIDATTAGRLTSLEESGWAGSTELLLEPLAVAIAEALRASG